MKDRKEEKRGSSFSICVVLNNIRSLYNVGSIFRTADGAGVKKIWLCGITGYPPHPQLTKTALGAETYVDWEYQRSARQVIEKLKRQGYQIVFIEQTKESVNFRFFHPRGPVCLVLGNEIEGVDKDLLSLCDQAVEIEMLGTKNSLNVAVAFGIVVYQMIHKPLG